MKTLRTAHATTCRTFSIVAQICKILPNLVTLSVCPLLFSKELMGWANIITKSDYDKQNFYIKNFSNITILFCCHSQYRGSGVNIPHIHSGSKSYHCAKKTVTLSSWVVKYYFPCRSVWAKSKYFPTWRAVEA